MHPLQAVEGWIGEHLYQFGVNLSTDLDAALAVVVVILLFLRLFQWKAMGKAILPVVGIYFILKVVLP